MFLIDKYKINSLNDITYHKDIYIKLLTPEKFYTKSKYINKNSFNKRSQKFCKVFLNL